ncbi:MAG: ribonuclease HII [Candidatus Woesearchaeota archaeon]
MKEEESKGKRIVCGIDEAGRGPVIGPMVICGACFEEGSSDGLRSIGIKDSKLLSVSARNRLFKEIVRACHGRYYVVIVSPREIDEAVFKKQLNLLEIQKSAEIINFLRPDVAILDCPDTNEVRYAENVKSLVWNKEIKIVAEHKADSKYPEVGAASILAKVIRDREIDKIKKKLGVDFGSGYPADPVTSDFIKKNWNNDKLEGIIRKSWAPVVEISRKSREEKRQKKIFDF